MDLLLEYDSKAVEEREWICGICLDLLRNAHSCINVQQCPTHNSIGKITTHESLLEIQRCENCKPSCMHTFCLECITNHVTQKGQCPNCRRPTDIRQLMPNTQIDRQLSSLRVRCPHQECTWTGQRGLYGKGLEHHLKQCDFELDRCLHCQTPMLRSLLKDHQNECPERPDMCIHCSKVTTFANRINHAETCPCRPHSCEECKAQFPYETLKDHEPVCPKRKVECPYCAQKVCLLKPNCPDLALVEHECSHEPCCDCCEMCPKETMYIHQQNVCEHRLIECEHKCGAEFKYSESEKHKCPNEIVSCLFLGCKWKDKRCHWNEHAQKNLVQHVTLLGLYSQKPGLNDMINYCVNNGGYCRVDTNYYALRNFYKSSKCLSNDSDYESDE